MKERSQGSKDKEQKALAKRVEELYVTRKIPVHGTDWIAHKEAARKEHPSDFLGSTLLKKWHDIYIEPATDIEAIIDYFKKDLPRRFKEVEEAVQETAKTDQEAVFSLFYEYFLQADDIDAIAEQLHFSYDLDEDRDWILSVTTVHPDEDIEAFTKQRHVHIAQEMAEIIVRQYREGGGPSWEASSPPNLFIEILHLHRQRLAQKERALQEEVKEYKARFLERFLQGIQDGKYPMDPTVARERIESTQVLVADEFISSLKEIWGDYDGLTHTIRIGATVPMERREQVYVHEMFHALSGKTETYTSSDSMPMDANMHSNHRVGLSFSPYLHLVKASEEPLAPQLTWLNEAMTEWLTIDLLGRGDGYPEERELLELLCSIGSVSLEMLRAAYFEDYHVPNAGKRPTPALRALFQWTDAHINTRFLTDLDLIIEDVPQDNKAARREKIRILIDTWKTRPVRFPLFVESLAEEIRLRRRKSIQKSV